MNNREKKNSVKNFKVTNQTKKDGSGKCSKFNRSFDIEIEKQFKRRKNIALSLRFFGKTKNNNLLLQEIKVL